MWRTLSVRTLTLQPGPMTAQPAADPGLRWSSTPFVPLAQKVCPSKVTAERALLPPRPPEPSASEPAEESQTPAAVHTTVEKLAVEGALAALADAYAGLEDTARHTMKAELGTDAVQFEHMLEMRYRGQKHTVAVPYRAGETIAELLAVFESTYKRRYGNLNPNCAVEILGARLGAEADIPRPELARLAGGEGAAAPGAVAPRERRSVHYPAPHGRMEVPVFARDALPAGHELEGPAVIEEYSSTTVLMPGDRARVGALGEIVIRCRP